MRQRLFAVALTAISSATLLAAPASAARPHRPGAPRPGIAGPVHHVRPVAPMRHRTCWQLNVRYRSGVGLVGARDRVRRGERPVFTFTRNNRAYWLNRHLDRDRDGIACERWRTW